MQIGGACDRSEPGIDNDEFRAVIARLPEPVSKRGKCLAHVCAADHHHLGVLEVGVVIRAPIEAESLLVSRAGTDHAEPAIVIQIARLECNSRELADQVALFVR
jgi:hypothetical protein